MAEIQLATGKKNNRGRSAKSLRVDLTPMVDLGFLLITFFILTTSWAEPKAMKLLMPADGTGTNVGESSSLTVLLMKNEIVYYEGSADKAFLNNSIGQTNYSTNNGIGRLIREKQLKMDKVVGVSRRDLMLIIKPTKESTYNNVVSVIDEVKINGVAHYALTDIESNELEMLEKIKK